MCAAEASSASPQWWVKGSIVISFVDRVLQAEEQNRASVAAPWTPEGVASGSV
jgi:hypothetical protein